LLKEKRLLLAKLSLGQKNIPKIEEILNNSGIKNYGQLAATDAAKVKEILAAAKLGTHDPATWSEQAQMAAEGKWDQLKKWQDALVGGKVV